MLTLLSGFSVKAGGLCIFVWVGAPTASWLLRVYWIHLYVPTYVANPPGLAYAEDLSFLHAKFFFFIICYIIRICKHFTYITYLPTMY